MAFRGTRTQHVAEIQEALSDWAELASLSERYEDSEEDEGERPLDAIRLKIAHRIFDHGTADDIYQCMRASRKYGGKCDCKEPQPRAEYTCDECYGNIEEAPNADES